MVLPTDIFKMLVVSNSPNFAFCTTASSSSRRRKRCSLVLLGVPVIVAIILVNFISCATGAIGKSKQLTYYQTIARHLNDFTVKDDAEDLLALPSDSNGASVSVVAPPPSFSRTLPVTQYAKTTGKSRDTKLQDEQQQQQSGKSKSNNNNKKTRGRNAQSEDNVAQESYQSAAYAPPPASFASASSSSKMLYHRSGTAESSGDSVAQESYQSNSYAPAPPSSVSPASTSSAAASSKTYAAGYDDYTSASKTSYSKSSKDLGDNIAQDSYQSNSYAPPPAAASSSSSSSSSVSGKSYGTEYASNFKTAYSSSRAVNDNIAEDSYQSPAYAPPPSPSPSSSSSSSSGKSYGGEYASSSSSSASKTLYEKGKATNDNIAQDSYQSNAYAAPPPPAPTSSSSSSSASGKTFDDYQQSSSSNSVAGNAATTKDDKTLEPQSSKLYAPPIRKDSSSYYEQYHRSSFSLPGDFSSDASTIKDNAQEESYNSRAYYPPPVSSSLTPADARPLPAASAKSYYEQYHRSRSSPATNDNQAQESYQTSLSYAPPPASSSQLSVPPVDTYEKNTLGVNDNQAQESYHTDLSYAPPPASHSSYYTPGYYSSPSSNYQSSYYPQTDTVAAGSPSLETYSSSYSQSSYGSPQAAPSSHQHNYYAPPPSQIPADTQSQASYQGDVAAQPYTYAPFPATTPVPAVRAQYLNYYPSSSKPTVLQPANSRSNPTTILNINNNNNNVIPSASVSSPSLANHPHLTTIDKHQQEQKQQQQQQQTAYSSQISSHTQPSGYAGEPFEFSPAPPGPPPPPSLISSPSTPQQQQPQIESAPPTQKDQSLSEDSLQKQQKLLQNAIGSGLDIYKLALTSPVKLVAQASNFLASLSIPKDHYLNVISFVGVYLFMSILLFGQDEIKQQKCDDGEGHLMKEWHYHVGRRFVPAIKGVDEKLQRKFLKLFKALHLEGDDDDDNGSSSEEEENNSMINYVKDMCPKEAFFFSLAPMHVEARMLVQRILVAQPSPAHVYSAAKALLYKHKIHPKVWYLGLVAAAIERPDMTGFKFAHPLDAIPDWFIPADLIQDEMDKYRARSLTRSLHKRIRRSTSENSTLTTTPSPAVVVSTLASDGNVTTTTPSPTTKFTRKPLLYTRRSTTTYRPPDFSYFSGDSGSVENFVLDGTPTHLKGDNKFHHDEHDYLPFDEEAINDSVQKFQHINLNGDKKYKPKKKEKKKKPVLPADDEQSQQQHSQQQDASGSASAEHEVVEADKSTAIDTSASAEADNSGGGSSAMNSQQNGQTSNNDVIIEDDEAAIVAPAAPSVRPSHLTSAHHNAIKVGDLTVVVGSGGPNGLLNDVPTYAALQDDDGHHHKKHHRHKGHHHKKKGHKKGHKGKKGKEDCIIVDGKTGRDNGLENKLWYFREDMMVNQFHWYWHLIHPVNATKHPDRRAELFFFTHRQFLARYNAERLSNGFAKMISMTNIGPGGILVEPYHSHLSDVASGKYWSPRHPRRQIRNIRHLHNPDIGMNIMLKDVATVYDRLIKSAKTGIMISQKQGLLPIRHRKGIEPLANTLEATELSVHPGIYDAFGLHNMGHLLIGLVEDPDWTYRKTPGVMAEVATAMRDPIFYNYHALVDNVIERHKETLNPYKVIGGEFPLLWRGVKILDMEMISKGNGPLNQLRTFWAKKKFELAPSVDGSTDKEDEHAQMCAVHLAHEPFTFKITIERKPCAKSKSSKGTIRIFIAPRFDEKGRRFHLREQRRLMIQLDAFQAKLRVGRNIITRRSHDSSLTQPWTKHLSDFEEDHPSGAADFCGCGWPQHLYIPKGNHKGMLFDLFVMVTNYDEDHVPNHPKDLELPETCNSPYLFCGHPRRRYPDARPMGYPWDRPPYKTPIPCASGHTFSAVVCKSFNLVAFKPIDFLEEFVAKATNMKSIVFDIRHYDKLVKSYHKHKRH